MQESSASSPGRAAPAAEPGRRPWRSVEIGAGLLLACGSLAGIVLWAKWGFLIAFDAVVTYCFG